MALKGSKQPGDRADKQAADLRQRAEETWLRRAEDRAEPKRAEPPPQLIEELQVHQIELEIQNGELRRAQQELEASRDKYFDLYDLAPVGYLTLSGQWLIEGANLTVAALLWVDRAGLVKRPLTRFIVPEDLGILHQLQRRLVQTGVRQTGDVRMVRPAGAPLWTRIEIIVKPNAEGRPPSYWAMVTDISEGKQAEQEIQRLNNTLEQQVKERTIELAAAVADLKRAAKMKDEFLAAVSHELRTPLTGVLSMAEVLGIQSSGPLNERQARYVQSIYQSGQRLLAMINGILRYTSLLGSGVTLQQEPCVLAELCAISVRAVRERADQKEQSLVVCVEPADLAISSNAQGIIQLLQQLLDNAVKFTPEGGRIGVEVHNDAAQNTVNLAVWDTGIGIAPEQQETIFQPFVQGDGSLARRFEGVGLGLAYVGRMVELLGGTIRMESALGEGSRFVVTLPR